MHRTMSMVIKNDTGLPLIFSNGYPTSINCLNEAQLECYLNYLYEFTDVPKSSRIYPPRTLNPKTRILNLKTTIKNVYDRLGARYLLHISESIALKYHPNSLSFEHKAANNLVNLYDANNGSFIVSVPRSNLTYDLGLQETLKFNTRKDGHSKNHWSNSFADEIISLDDSEDEDYQSNLHGRDKGPLPVDSRLAPSSKEEVILISDSEEVDDDTNVKKKSPAKSSTKNFLNHAKSKSNSEPSNRITREVIYLPPPTDSNETSHLKRISTADIDLSDCSETPVVISDSDEEQEDPLKDCSSPGIFNKTDHLTPKSCILVRNSAGQTFRYMTHNSNLKAVSVRRRAIKQLHKKGGSLGSSELTPGQKKVNYMNQLGLFESSDPPDDPIILPEINKKDFVKFHKLPLNLVIMLASKDVIRSSCLTPGPPGQDSKSTSTSRLDISKLRKSGKLLSTRSNGRHRHMDYKNARNYVFPKRTFRTITPVPIPYSLWKPAPKCYKRKIGSEGREFYPSLSIDSSESSCEAFLRSGSSSIYSESDEDNSEVDRTIPIKKTKFSKGGENSEPDQKCNTGGTIFLLDKQKVKPCFVKLMRLNPFIERYYIKQYRDGSINL